MHLLEFRTASFWELEGIPRSGKRLPTGFGARGPQLSPVPYPRRKKYRKRGRVWEVVSERGLGS